MKNNMMKKLLTLVLAGAMTLSLAACGAKDTPSADQPDNSTEEAKTYKVAVIKQLDHASLDEIANAVTAELDKIAADNGVTIEYEVTSGQGDQTILKQLSDQAIADGVNAIIPIATTAAQIAALSAEETKTPVVYAAISDPETAKHTGIDYVTGTSDALNTEFIMDMMFAQNPNVAKVGLLYSLNEPNSTKPVADAKAYLDAKGIEYVEQTANTNDEVVAAASALIAAGVDAVFTPTDNVIMAAEMAIAEDFAINGIPHYTGADSFVRNGAYATCGVNYTDLGAKTADLAYKAITEGMDGMEDYFRASLDLLDSSVRRELFQSDRPIRTKAHDTPPALYAPGSAVKNSVMTAGSIIEGSVENSVCFRNVRIEKGAVVKNCVLMEKCVVKAGARLENVVCDKNVTVSEDKIVCGTAEHPCVLAKGGVV